MNLPINLIAKNFINIIYPLHCEYCKARLDPMDTLGVCPSCISKITKNPAPHCGSCGRPIKDAPAICPECRVNRFYFTRAYSACLHEGIMKELIHAFKYRSRISLGGILSRFMIDFIKNDPRALEGIDAVTFVPIQARRLRERDFNQSRVLASKLSKALEMPLIDALKKVRSTRPQNELSRDERLRNLDGAFAARTGHRLEGLRLLLIDDVMATGTTLNEASKALLGHGAKEIICLTLSRGL